MNSPRLSIRGIKYKRGKPHFDDDGDDDSGDDDSGIFEHTALVLSQRGGVSMEALDSTGDYSPAEIREACVLFSIVGVGYLFPFSALTQPVDYWQLLFPDFNIEFPLTTMYMYTNLVMLALLVFFGGTPNFTQRIVFGFVGQLLVLVFVPTSYFLHLDEASNEMAILGATAAAAIVTAFIDSSVIALASQYPLRVQEYFQFGIGLSTLIGSIYRDATKIVFPPDMIVESSLLYFYSGAATIGLCILSYYRLIQLDMSKKCLAKAVEAEQGMHHDAHHDDAEAPKSETSALLLPDKFAAAAPPAPSEPDKWVVFKKIFFNESMVLLLFMSTLALWPPLVTEIKSFNFPSLQSSGWWPLILLTVFSVCDCSGRLLVRFRLGITRHNIWMAILARFSLFPLILCSVEGYVVTNDVLSCLFVGALGLTNGYVGTLSIILVNECVEEDEQAVAGTFTGFFLNSGLVLGATLGLIADKLV
jgi:equilibrative nucleoside transporter 1/2/3